MNIGKRLLVILILVLLLPLSASANVTVFAEGAYTDSDLVVYIYANTGSEEALLSYGVKLNYDPTNLGSPVIERNEEQWYFGDGTTTYPTSPANTEDTSTAGQVIIVGGKLDATKPLEGVSGDRVELARVTFTRLTDTLPINVELYLGKGGQYSNFVQVNGNDLDQALAGDGEANSIGYVEIHKRGDANGDGKITNNDRAEVRNLIFSDKYTCYADANGDGKITNNDRGVIRNMIFEQ